MRREQFHGILVDAAFTEPSFPESFRCFAHEQSGTWGLFGIIVPRSELEDAIAGIQAHMRKDQPFYAHLYDDETLVVIFKERCFRVTPHRSTWAEIEQYGRGIAIPAEQLDFWPNRFQDEPHYFKPDSFTHENPLNQ